ncbi:Agmatine coumaroyltransferase-2 [Platanthera guangdongensis]|uniref:Agmatine coumaroyltransferase-2 n=1 Tax=Platanthera guangdongensis TaxID=2320717 RepID=A0ABR2N411_9ASPA
MEVHIQRCSEIATSPLTKDPLVLPLTIFDRFASNIHIAVLFAFSPPTPTNIDLIESLSKTLLLHFPTLGGRLGGTAENPTLVLGDGGGGALLVEAEVDSNLDDHMPLCPSPDLVRLHPSTVEASHLLQVQLNRFRCGGLIVGVTAHHRVADGQSMSTFYTSWGKMSRGIPVKPVPNTDQSWLKTRFPPKCEFEHWGAEFSPIQTMSNCNFLLHPSFVDQESTSNIMLHYSHEFINSELKAGLKEKMTTFQVLLGHVWRKIIMARALGRSEETMIRVSVNGRPRLRPPVAGEFIGNLVLNAYPSADAGELIEGGLERAARIIGDAVKRIDDKYFQSFIDFGEVYKDEKLVPIYDMYGNYLSPNLEVDSWLGFQFEDVDFGGGGALCAFLPTWVPMDGLVILLPSLSEDGGVDVVVALLKEHANILKTISHSLK